MAGTVPAARPLAGAGRAGSRLAPGVKVTPTSGNGSHRSARPGRAGTMHMQVTIIGGGSYQWGPTLMADLLLTPAFADGGHLVLEDIDPAPLVEMEALAHRMIDQLGVRATVSTTTDQRRSLDGADFVVVTISTGGFESMSVDLDVPARHGIRQSVGDSVGPGWHQPVAAQHPRARRHRPGHGGALPGRVAAQHHQPDDRADPIGVPGDVDQDRRAVPRGRQLPVRPGDRAEAPPHRGATDGERRQPLPGRHRARGRRARRLRRAARAGRLGRRDGGHRARTPTAASSSR